MTTDNVNRFEGFESNGEGNKNQENSYNREGNTWGEGRRPAGQRARFVRNSDGVNRPQRPRMNREDGAPRYAKVERTPRSFGQDGDERPYRSSYNRDRGGYNRERNFNNDRSYNNDRPSYNRDRSFNSEGGSYGSRERSSYGNRSNYSQRPQRNFNYSDSGNSWNGERDNNTFRPRRPRTDFNNGEARPNRYGGEGRRQEGFNPQFKGPRFGQRPAFGENRFPRKKQIQYREEAVDPNEPIRLNKYLANAGICSRREADDFITAGVVSVNGTVVTELGTKVKRGDEVRFHDQTVSIERKVYLLLNKPKDYVTTVEDPQDRKTVMDLVKDACRERIYPVGRLDRNTTGVLLLTNDGEMASKLTHPRFLKKKVYHARLDKNLTHADMEQLAKGVQLEDGEIHCDEISYTSETDHTMVGVEIHSGRNRIVRRMFEALGYRVIRLDRVQFAGLTKKNLRRGDWRFLTEKEVNMLRMGAFE